MLVGTRGCENVVECVLILPTTNDVDALLPTGSPDADMAMDEIITR